jgi:potassium-transporting ATPase KdpC subunit
MIKLTIQSVLQTLLWTILLGVIYPLVMTIFAQVCFPYQANGSLIKDASGNIIGSELIAQQFTGNCYFWPRPSATTYATMPAGASNLGPTSKQLQSNVQSNAAAFRSGNNLPADAAVPSDMVFASASGVDPDISPAAAQLQIGRVAAARGLGVQDVTALVEQFTEGPQFGFLGETRVNVLRLNVAMDNKWPKTKPAVAQALPTTPATATPAATPATPAASPAAPATAPTATPSAT